MEYTSHGTSPEIFRKWGGIVAIAGALERRVWARTMGRPLYPHLYTIFVAPPGVGKSIVTDAVRELWRAIPNHFVAASSVNFASIMDDLREAQRNLIIPGQQAIQYNSLKVVANELQVLIPDYEASLMGKLTDLYDAKFYDERRRNEKNSFAVESPQLNFLAGTTPKYMTSTFPETAWDLGFMSRTLMIFHGTQEIKSLFSAPKNLKELEANLQKELDAIATLYGEYVFTEEAALNLDAWHRAKGPPTPDHPRLVGYCSRRTTHVVKLMMVSAADRGDDLVLDNEDFERALEWLLEAEMYMPEVFKAMSATGDGKIIEDLHHAMWRTFLKNNRVPIPRKFVYHYLQKRLPAYAVQGAIDGMVASGLLKTRTVEELGPCYEPQMVTSDL